MVAANFLGSGNENRTLSSQLEIAIRLYVLLANCVVLVIPNFNVVYISYFSPLGPTTLPASGHTLHRPVNFRYRVGRPLFLLQFGLCQI